MRLLISIPPKATSWSTDDVPKDAAFLIKMVVSVSKVNDLQRLCMLSV